MKAKDFKKAVRCATAFLAQAKVVEAQTPNLEFFHGKESATLKRRSMDLTRSLADLRHPWRNQ